MRLAAVDARDARAVLRGLRAAVLGAGPAIALGAGVARPLGRADDASVVSAGGLPPEVPAGTAVVVTTSGSTGYPKAVALSRSALTASALATAERIGEGAWLLALPPGYIAGVQVLVRSLVAGREPAILSGVFSAPAFAAAAASMASSVGGMPVPAYTSLVPAQLQTVLDDPAATRALAGFAAVLVGGQALAPALAARAADAGVRVVRTYGSSETAGGCVYDGAPLRDVGIRVVDGEVQLSGPTLADGYLGDPARTEAAFVRDADGVRWYRTGDTGALADGRLQIIGRADNVIVSGGVNVSLDRVEKAVRTVTGFADAVVVPVADARWGQASVVVATGSAAHRPDARATVRDAVEAALGKPARPREIVAVAAIPLLSSGKPDRRTLRRLVEDAGGASPAPAAP